MTTKNDIRNWLDNGEAIGATHVLIVCDNFSNEDYPVYVMELDDIHEKIQQYHHKNMQKIMEIYNLSLNIDAQLRQSMSWNTG